MKVKRTEMEIEDKEVDDSTQRQIASSFTFKVGDNIDVVATVKVKNPTSGWQKLFKRIESILYSAVHHAEHPTQEEIQFDPETGEVLKVGPGVMAAVEKFDAEMKALPGEISIEHKGREIYRNRKSKGPRANV